MKHVFRVLIILIFFVLVFIPRTVIGVLNYWLLFLLLFFVVFLYLMSEYYVSKKAVSNIIKDSFDFSILCEKVPFDANNDFLRGRLVIYNSTVLLYTKQKGKVVLSWSKEINEIDSIEFGKISTKRHGFKFICDEQIYEFVTYFLKVNQDDFIKALDFQK
ncbi:MAG: hypothetical protein EOL97_02170 [Spirochaetia bacterium]|nr:hypothetical protein [Spirochaetia bacterium]